MNDDLVDRLRLVRSAGIGPLTFRQLMRRFRTVQMALLELDLAGRLDRRGGNKVSLRAG